MENYENITHNTIIEYIDNYRNAYREAKNLLEEAKEMLASKTAEEWDIDYYCSDIKNLLGLATRDGDPEKLLPIIRLINQTYGNHQTLPKCVLTQKFLDVRQETHGFADKISQCLDSIDFAIHQGIKYNTMTAKEKENLSLVKTLKNQLSKMIREAGYEEIHVERGKKLSDYDERLIYDERQRIIEIADAPARTSSDQLIITGYCRGLRCKYTGALIKPVSIFLEREDIENSI
ncbi:MAG: hypothetical protein J6A28_00910 [Clostridia bacterium]|nr:hypothetical protein [Clostridia bacterium]